MSTNKLKLKSDKELHYMIEDAFMGFEPGSYKMSDFHNILLDENHRRKYSSDPVFEILDVMRRPEYFAYTCKWLFNLKLLPFQLFILRKLWEKKFPMLIACRGGSKTFLLSLYALLRAMFEPGAKIVVVGASYRQSRLLWEYMYQFWKNAPILRSLVGGGKYAGPKREPDRCSFFIGDSQIHGLPIGDGSKIRGMRAGYVIADEFASLTREVFEVVIRGFASVSSRPDERVYNNARIKVLKQLGMYNEAQEAEEEMGFGNQIVISGTAYYRFNFFFDYYQRYKQIIESGGDQRKLEEVFKGSVPETFNHKDYCIFRVPDFKFPDGFMDMTQIGQAQATMHQSMYQMEYGAVFPSDSNGFFKRSLIEECVTTEPIQLPSGPVHFPAIIRGEPRHKYIYGIDPASEQDNFAIVILEQHADHRRIVYVWSTNRQAVKHQLKNSGDSSRQSFYTYCARKIRSLMKVFPTEHIGIDAQGGGITIMEALHDQDLMQEGEQPLWPYIKTGDKDPYWWEPNDLPEHNEAGLHILHSIQFANSTFTVEANHGLRKDLENKVLLFPYFDSATIAESEALDQINNREYDTLEDCVLEIEELKDELGSIQHTQTNTGRDKWDTPEIKLPGGRKGRERKDRYSALLIANMIGRVEYRKLTGTKYNFVGSYVGKKRGPKNSSNQPLYTGPAHKIRKMGYGRAV